MSVESQDERTSDSLLDICPFSTDIGLAWPKTSASSENIFACLKRWGDPCKGLLLATSRAVVSECLTGAGHAHPRPPSSPHYSSRPRPPPPTRARYRSRSSRTLDRRLFALLFLRFIYTADLGRVTFFFHPAPVWSLPVYAHGNGLSKRSANYAKPLFKAS
jgi:hypothetical protein